MLASLTGSLTSYVRDHGVYAVLLLMLVDAVFPAASELVMVVGGALAAGAFGASVSLFGMNVAHGFWSYVVIALAGTIGYLVAPCSAGRSASTAAGRCSRRADGGSISATRASRRRSAGSIAGGGGPCSSAASRPSSARSSRFPPGSSASRSRRTPP